MSYNDLTIETASPYAGEPEIYHETLAALLVFSLLFHRDLIFLDVYLINNPTLRRVARNLPAIFDCLELASVRVALRRGYSDLSGLMELQAARDAYHPFFKDQRDRYLKEDIARILDLGSNISSQHRYDVSAQSEKFTSLAIQNLERAYPRLGANSPNQYGKFINSIKELKSTSPNQQLTQFDFRWDDPRSRLNEILRRENLMDWCKTNEHLIYDLQTHAYRMTSSGVLDVRSIIDRKADEVERLMSPDIILKEQRILLENRYFYAHNLARITPEVIEKILQSPEALAFFDVRDSQVGDYSYETHSQCTFDYIKSIDRILTDNSARLGLTPGKNASVKVLTRTSEAFYGAAEALRSNWSKFGFWADVCIQLHLDRIISLALKVEVSFSLLKDALSASANVAQPMAHALQVKTTEFAIKHRERMEQNFGPTIQGNIERVTGNTIQL